MTAENQKTWTRISQKELVLLFHSRIGGIGRQARGASETCSELLTYPIERTKKKKKKKNTPVNMFENMKEIFSGQGGSVVMPVEEEKGKERETKC